MSKPNTGGFELGVLDTAGGGEDPGRVCKHRQQHSWRVFGNSPGEGTGPVVFGVAGAFWLESNVL